MSDKVKLRADLRELVNSHIAYGQVNNTSTSTVFTATVPNVNQLVDGTTVMLRNGVVTSASGFTINVNGLGAKPVYNSMADATADTTIFNINYTMLFVYDSTRINGGCWICYRGYNTNDNTIGYQIRTNNTVFTTTDRGYRYRLWLQTDEGKLMPVNTSTSTNATANRSSAMNTREFWLNGKIIYNSTKADYQADVTLPAGTMWQQYNFALGYSFNNTGKALTLTSGEPLYMVATDEGGGKGKLASPYYTQTLPSSADGKLYIYLGHMTSAVNMELALEHPIFEYKDNGIRLYRDTYTTSEIDTLLNGKSDTGHTHTGYANSTHNHTKNQITDFPALSTVATTGSYNDLSDKPNIPEGSTVDTTLSGTSNNAIANSTVKNALDNKLDKTHTSYKGKNVVTNSSTGAIEFEEKNNHTHSQYITEHQSLSNYVTNSDSRLSDARTPLSHTHGNLQNNGQVGSTAQANKNVVTDGNGLITTEDKPTIPSASSTTPSADTTNGSVGTGTTWARSNHTHPKSSIYAESTHSHTKSEISDFPLLHTVATSGSYNDLTNKPNIPSGVVVDTSLDSTSDHAISNSAVTTALNGKSDTGHTHNQYLTSHQDITGKLDKTQTSYKGKNVVVDSTSGEITFEDKNNHTHSNYLTSSDISGKIDTAGTGLSKNGTTLNHSNSVTAQNSEVFKKFKYDATGHITGVSDVTSSDLPTHTHSQYITSAPTDVSELTDNNNTPFTPKTHNHGNLQDDGKIKINGTTQTSKNVVTDSSGNITTESKPNIPSKTSDLTNDSGFLTSHQDISSKLDIAQTSYKGKNVVVDSTTGNITFENKPSIPSASSTTPSADTQGGSYGTGTDYARANHTHPKSTLYAEANHNHDSNYIAKASTDTGFVKSDGSIDGSTYLTTANASSTYVPKETGKGLFSGSYSDLTNKPSYTATVTNSTTGSYEIGTINISGTDVTIYGKDTDTHQSLTNYLQQSDVKNNLTSTDTNKPLSANQGKELKTLVDGKANSTHSHNDLSQSIQNLGQTIRGLSEVATSGDYNDLDNKPSIPTDVSDLTDTSNTQFTPKSHTHDDRYYTESEVDTALNGKQSTLVSGSNIKTVNNESLLGNGNLDIRSGGSYLNNFYRDSTTKELIIDYTTYTDLTGSEIVTSWSSTPTDIKVPSEKLVKDTFDGILDLVYPVGSIYMSVNSTSPATLFGGTWEQIKDTFLLASGNTYNADPSNVNTAQHGEATHTLTTNEMPSHNHTQDGHRHHYSRRNVYLLTGNGAGAIGHFTDSSYDDYYTDWQTPTINSNGGGEAHNNMPPYLAVYMWKRTA